MGILESAWLAGPPAVPEKVFVVQIYIYQIDRAVGPYTEEQLRVLVDAGAITKTEHAWHEGLAEWQPLDTIISFAAGGGPAPAPNGPAVPAAPKKKEQAASKKEQTGTALNVLVADDEKSTAMAVCYILGQAGHDVDVVHDGVEALEILMAVPTQYQILITDHRMINMTGLELVEKLKKTKFRGKIIVFTGYITEELEDSYRELGITHFFNK
ncbi:MAG: response regulator, partial [Chthoniobacteraceae bacterium]